MRQITACLPWCLVQLRRARCNLIGRPLFIFAMTASLVVASAASLQWVRSYWFDERVIRIPEGSRVNDLPPRGKQIPFAVGRAAARRDRSLVGGQDNSHWRLCSFASSPRDDGYRSIEVLGFLFKQEWFSDAAPSTYEPLAVAVPYWAIVGLLLLGPAASARRWRRRRQQANFIHKNLCPNCGYNTHATPRRCPSADTCLSARP